MRNPKRDPAAGDVLVKGASVRKVTSRERDQMVRYTTRTGVGKLCHLSIWRVWAGSACVLGSGDSVRDDRADSLSVRYVELEERVRIAEERYRLTDERLSRLEALIGSGPGIGVDSL